MTPRHLLQVGALTSALTLTGAAMAQDMHGSPLTDDRGRLSANESPAAGAIITPEDKAAGLGRHDAPAVNRNGARDDDTSTANDDVSVNPGASSDEMAVNPGRSSDDISVNPGATSNDRDVNPGAASDDSDVNPGAARGRNAQKAPTTSQ